jgi:hypothetical protein
VQWVQSEQLLHFEHALHPVHAVQSEQFEQIEQLLQVSATQASCSIARAPGALCSRGRSGSD